MILGLSPGDVSYVGILYFNQCDIRYTHAQGLRFFCSSDFDLKSEGSILVSIKVIISCTKGFSQ